MTIFKDLLKRTTSSPTATAGNAVAGTLLWTCNICGTTNNSLAKDMDRETGACVRCGSVMRFRALAAILTLRLFGEVKILRDLPPDPSLKGVGMSDAGCYADVLERKCTYTNTFYHCEPLLDIMQPKERWLGDNDFVITSDVFEHVPPPIQRAFDNLLALLKPGGVTIFSVPYTLQSDTLEHYPNLCDFSIRQDEKGEWVLDNLTQQGVKEEFRDLIFHGGPGSTLELRVFGLPALKAHFEASGFADVRIHSEPYFEYGIFWLHPWSLVISALRPR